MVVGLVIAKHNKRNQLVIRVNGWDNGYILCLDEHPCHVAFQLTNSQQRVMLAYHKTYEKAATDFHINREMETIEDSMLQWFIDNDLIESTGFSYL